MNIYLKRIRCICYCQLIKHLQTRQLQYLNAFRLCARECIHISRERILKQKLIPHIPRKCFVKQSSAWYFAFLNIRRECFVKQSWYPLFPENVLMKQNQYSTFLENAWLWNKADTPYTPKMFFVKLSWCLAFPHRRLWNTCETKLICDIPCECFIIYETKQMLHNTPEYFWNKADVRK